MTVQLVTVLFVVLGLGVLVMILLFFSLLRVWVKALTSGTPVAIFHIIGMKLRGNPANLLIDAHIILSKENITGNLDETEYTYMQNRNRIHSAEDLIRLVKEKKQKR